MKIGCHVSIAGGIDKAPERAHDLGCEVFQVFTRSPQGGKAPELSQKIIFDFKSGMKNFGLAQAVVHTPYFINFGSAETRIFYGSVAVVRQELERASLLGAAFVITHLGSFKDLGEKKGFAQLVAGLEKSLERYVGSAQLLIENSAGAGEIIGDTFEEITAVISHPKLKKFHLGVCLDTCHAFASGYDMRGKAAVAQTLKSFEKIVGLQNLKAIHINDSQTDLGSRRDRHAHLGRGKIGLEGFKALLRHSALAKINLYLETEHDLVKEDLEILKKMRKE